MNIEVDHWVTIAASNGDPATGSGHAVVGAVCRGVLPTLTPGQPVDVEDNPANAFTVAATEAFLGVVVLKYSGDVEQLALSTPAEGNSIVVPG